MTDVSTEAGEPGRELKPLHTDSAKQVVKYVGSGTWLPVHEIVVSENLNLHLFVARARVHNFICTFHEHTGPDTAGDRSWTVILLLQQQKQVIDHKSIFPDYKEGLVSSHSKTNGKVCLDQFDQILFGVKAS